MQTHISKKTEAQEPANVQRKKQDSSPLEVAQRMQPLEEEELLQGKFEAAQRMPELEEEELLQGKFATAQRMPELEEEELLQGKFQPVQRQANNTGLPDNLKSGIENLSGYSMDDVKVHYNSDQPAQLNAHAYAQGTDIHLAPGQEQHLPHEAWHVVQQKQGRVRPTMQLKGKVNINDDAGLEREADVMGARAVQLQIFSQDTKLQSEHAIIQGSTTHQYFPVQRSEEGEHIGKQIGTVIAGVIGAAPQALVIVTNVLAELAEASTKYADALKAFGGLQIVAAFLRVLQILMQWKAYGTENGWQFLERILGLLASGGIIGAGIAHIIGGARLLNGSAAATLALHVGNAISIGFAATDFFARIAAIKSMYDADKVKEVGGTRKVLGHVSALVADVLLATASGIGIVTTGSISAFWIAIIAGIMALLSAALATWAQWSQIPAVEEGENASLLPDD